MDTPTLFILLLTPCSFFLPGEVFPAKVHITYQETRKTNFINGADGEVGTSC